MSKAMQLTALYDQAAPENLLIDMNEVRDRGMIDLRGMPQDRKFMAACKQVFGVALPKKPRTSANAGTKTLLWLSVDQWLVLCPLKEKDALLKELDDALAGIHASCVDMSDARAVLRLEGEHVRHVLMKGTSIDFTQKEFSAGSVRRLTFGEIAALVHIVNDAPDIIDIYMFRSQAHHAWNWVISTSQKGSETGLPGSLETPRTV